MENIQEYVEAYSVFGAPIIYKSIKIYPVLAKDYYTFMGISDILKIEKNKTADIEIIQMSYLYYILQLMLYDIDFRDAFLTLVNLVFHLDYNEKDKINDFQPNEILMQNINEKNCDYYFNGWKLKIEMRGKAVSLFIDDKCISASDFEDIRRIILFQNIYDFNEIELNMSDDFRKVVEKYYELKNRGIAIPNLEKKVAVVMSHSSYKLEDMQNLPMRMLDIMFNNIIAETDYIATKSLEVHLEKGHTIDHWIYHKEKQKFMDVFQDVDTVASKVTGT
jgi:hypothetical protein